MSSDAKTGTVRVAGIANGSIAAAFAGGNATNLASPDARAVLALAPTPAAAAKLTTARIAAALRRAGRQRGADQLAARLHKALPPPASSGPSSPPCTHPEASTLYYQRREHGDRHAAALRNVFNRLLGCLYHCLQTGQTYNEAIAFPPPIRNPNQSPLDSYQDRRSAATWMVGPEARGLRLIVRA